MPWSPFGNPLIPTPPLNEILGVESVSLFIGICPRHVILPLGTASSLSCVRAGMQYSSMLSCESVEAFSHAVPAALSASEQALLGNASGICHAFDLITSASAHQAFEPTALILTRLSMLQRDCSHVFEQRYGSSSTYGVGLDVGHVFGAWNAEHASRLTDGDVGSALSRAVERVCTHLILREGFEAAPIHSTVWQAIVLRAAKLAPWQWSADLWPYLEGVLCNTSLWRLESYVHEEGFLTNACVHGFGHGVFRAAAISCDMDERTNTTLLCSSLGGRAARRNSSACYPLRRNSLSYHYAAAPKRVAHAVSVCEAAPTLNLAYVCTTGVYMELFSIVDKSVIHWPAGSMIALCTASRFPAPCFRSMFKFMHIKYDLQKHGFGMCSLANPWSQRSAKGCIFAIAAAHANVKDIGKMCSVFVPPFWPLWRTKTRHDWWRACIAGLHFGAWRAGQNRSAIVGTCAASLPPLLSNVSASHVANANADVAFCRQSEEVSADVEMPGRWGGDTDGGGSRNGVAPPLGMRHVSTARMRHWQVDLLDPN